MCVSYACSATPPLLRHPSSESISLNSVSSTTIVSRHKTSQIYSLESPLRSARDAAP